MWVGLLASLLVGCRGGSTSLEVSDATLQGMLERGPVLLQGCVPFLGACKEHAAKWAEVARRVDGGGSVTVAHVDLMHNPVTKARLELRRFPAVLVLSEGRVFTMERPHVATVDQMVAFAQGGFRAVTSAPLPPVPHLTPWFETHDYVNRLDGKTYKGAVF